MSDEKTTNEELEEIEYDEETYPGINSPFFARNVRTLSQGPSNPNRYTHSGLHAGHSEGGACGAPGIGQSWRLRRCERRDRCPDGSIVYFCVPS